MCNEPYSNFKTYLFRVVRWPLNIYNVPPQVTARAEAWACLFATLPEDCSAGLPLSIESHVMRRSLQLSQGLDSRQGGHLPRL